MKTNLIQMFNYLSENNVNYCENNHICRHWRLKNIKNKDEIIKNIFMFLGCDSLRTKYFCIRKRNKDDCPYENCVNPDCYKIVLNNNIKKDTSAILSSEDIKEIAEEIILEDYYRLGEKEFLEQYNANQPDFLKITAQQLKVVINYKKENIDD